MSDLAACEGEDAPSTEPVQLHLVGGLVKCFEPDETVLTAWGGSGSPLAHMAERLFTRGYAPECHIEILRNGELVTQTTLANLINQEKH